ncbi:reverse transcriptase family protein [Rugamonas apoptosis]|uniref:RNA-directed DNA polymerase n=1 Tax=Rugamonas apoptosis TaxID=2758570 RepID=A0A7W2F759_9BURK|nr:reverse transcriptase family protein [Rugamonas apoptosis]MBA5686319.1 RNA-directed DNA polymerase [Rugamonas apoptosis]
MWSPRHYLEQGRLQKQPSAVLAVAVEQIKRLQAHNPPLPPILTLKHLAKVTKVRKAKLECFVERIAPEVSYKRFNIKKRTSGYRKISIPEPDLMKVQAWISQNILQLPSVHSASKAFRKHDSILKCAEVHCGAKWMIKIDIADFFGSITEIQAYRVFKDLGYNPLISFHMARICTDLIPKSQKYKMQAWQIFENKYSITEYHNKNNFGRLPQGAPTSPLLSNLVMLRLDKTIAELAEKQGLRYTRYSDDITFSTKGDYSRKQAVEFVASVSALLKADGLYLNRKKTVIVPPGSRKIVLGLLTDREYPNLTKEFKEKLRQHLYYIKTLGVEAHMRRREFDSVGGLYRHILGLINYANLVDPTYAYKMKQQFKSLPWPGQ